MRIFNYNPQIQNLDQYILSIQNAPEVSGVFINVILDTEFRLNLYIPDTNQYILLEEFLEKFKSTNKIVIMNMLLAYQLVTDQTAFEIANFNRTFVNSLKNLISRYPNTFYLSSINTSTLFFLNTESNPYKVGTVITRADLGFIDVDFYIFSEYFINIEFINSLLNQNKEVMVFPDSSNLVSQLPQEMRNKLDFIVQTPV